MQVSEILEKKGDRVVSIGQTATIAAVADKLSQERVGALVVKANGGDLAGIISERDIVRGIAEHGPAAMDLPVSELMSQSLVTCSPKSSTEDVMTQMLERQIRHLPVIRDNALVGIISIGDVVKAVLSELRWMTKILQDQVVAAAGRSADEE
jgi:CBS domain-containing protein